MPGVQTLLPVMITMALQEGLLDLPKLARMTSENAARIYGIEGKGGIQVGNDADLVLVDVYARKRMERDMVQSKCGWSPFEGEMLQGFPEMVLLRGKVQVRNDQRTGPPSGAVVNFKRERIPTAGARV
jgi:dihydroorotase